jgi:hypothetical protein
MVTENVGNKIILAFNKGLHIINACGLSENVKSSKLAIFCDQIIDSTIVGGITGISTYIAAGEKASITSALLAFLLTLLIKMKEYRNIK